MRCVTTRDESDTAMAAIGAGQSKALAAGAPNAPRRPRRLCISADGVYDANLLLAALCGRTARSSEGVSVVDAPAKGPRRVTGSHNRAGIAQLRALAVELAAG